MTRDDSALRTLHAHRLGLTTWGLERVARIPSGRPPVTSDPVDPDARGDAAPAIESDTPGLPAADVLAADAAVVAECTRCSLCETRTRTVYGVGDPNARLMFVGEAPGRDEDLQGEPFVGKAGQLLDKIIGAMTLRREDVFIANVLKCRPPGNRDPRPDEVAACKTFLQRQIDAIQPEILVALGRPAANTLLGNTLSIARMRGSLHECNGTPVVVTYHPAYLLRSPGEKRKTWEDMQMVMTHLGIAIPGS